MAKKKQGAFKMFYPGGPLVIPQSATPAAMADALTPAPPTPNITQPMKAPQAPQATGMDLSQIGGVAQGALGLYETISGNLSVPKIQEQDFTSGSKQELLSKATGFKGYEMPKTNAVSSGLGGAASGAAAGTAIAPGIGTVIGGAVGLVGGVASSIFGNSKRKRAKRRAERAAMNNINAQNTELTEDSIYSNLSSQLANGGSLVEFKNGGSHEENPLGGIPQGYNENGDLNLVEQGETKWNDYIFSDRNKLSKAERFGLPGILNNKTFSSAAKTIQKESKERPFDLISKRGLEKQMDYLISAQEENNAMLENTNQFKSGGQMNFKSKNRNLKTVKHGYGDWLRYAPVASNIIGLATDIASTPDTVETARIEAPSLSEKMSYDPIDQEYLTNKLTSNYASLVDKIQGSSGGNRGVANASMIAAMNNLYDAYGDTAIKSKGYNRDMLAKTLEFNRATSQANAQMRMTADQYNANAEDRMIATNAANRAARRNAIREQMAGLGENLGAIGTEQRWMDLAPKLFRGYKSNGDYIDQTIRNIVLDKSDSPSPLEVAKSRGLIKEPSRKISQKFIDLAADLQAKANDEKRKKTNTVVKAGGGDLYYDPSWENRGKPTAQTDNTYVEKPRVEEPVERSVNGVKWSDLDFKTQMMNRGNLVNGYPTEKGLEIVSPEFDIISGIRGITNLLPKTQTFYHGSPVRFNKFNTQFIGSGEGGSKAMKGINLWPDNHFGAAPKFANIRSSDAPLHLGRASKEISGELNPTIYKVRGRNLNIYSSNTSKGLDQQELVNLGYDGFSNGKQYTIFPESVHKLKIKKHYSIPEFVKTHKKIDSWAPWSTDINKMNNILELAGSSKRF